MGWEGSILYFVFGVIVVAIVAVWYAVRLLIRRVGG